MSKRFDGPNDARWNALWGKGSRGGESRSNALWGKGGRGGDGSRSNALWGKGSRGTVLATVATFLLVLPMGAMAGPNPTKSNSGKSDLDTYVAVGLLEKAGANPESMLKLIIQSSEGVAGAEKAFKEVDAAGELLPSGKLKRRLGVVGGVAVEMKAKKVAKLSERRGLIITPDARVKLAGDSSSEVWTAAANVQPLWSSTTVTAPAAPTIAIVDTGVENRADFTGRLLASVTFTTSLSNAAGDGRGHGTIVAGLAAGAAEGYAGAAPNAPIVSLDVLDDAGTGSASDVIAAAEWILANKSQYNIRVANFSLGAGASGSSFRFDPLNKAVQKLWLAGVTVVASSGNYGTADGASGVKYTPGNDPFIITVGATDPAGTAGTADDFVAPWSAWGSTADGFRKPEISAPGRYMVGPVPAGSSLPLAFPERVVAPGYMRMSGTSFSAGVVSGIAAQLLARHPEWGPDQVKGALMLKAQPLPLVPSYAEGVGVVDAAASAEVSAPPNPNHALNGFVVSNSAGARSFDQAAWFAVASTNSTWDESTWQESTWQESTWQESTWQESTWQESTWAESLLGLIQ